MSIKSNGVEQVQKEWREEERFSCLRRRRWITYFYTSTYSSTARRFLPYMTVLWIAFYLYHFTQAMEICDWVSREGGKKRRGMDGKWVEGPMVNKAKNEINQEQRRTAKESNGRHRTTSVSHLSQSSEGEQEEDEELRAKNQEEHRNISFSLHHPSSSLHTSTLFFGFNSASEGPFGFLLYLYFFWFFWGNLLGGFSLARYVASTLTDRPTDRPA
jgi:hypothetical protein